MTGSITDVDGILVGHWTDAEAATGCTVVLCPPGTVGACDARGPAPGTRETDLLRPGNLVQHVDAVLLTGGSAFGLDAAGGVMRWLEEHGCGYSTPAGPVPIVPGAVLYDLGIGSPSRRPSAEAGYAAAACAGREAAWGSVGAGTGATVAKAAGMDYAVKGGVGTASEWAGPVVVGAVVVLNAFGDIIDPAGGAVLAEARLGGPATEMLRALHASPSVGGNTTLVAVATNARIDRSVALRMASVAHNGIARCVRPSHTPFDGDVAFALATGAVPVDAELGPALLGALSELATERALLHALRSATSLAGVPAIAELGG